MTKKIFLLFLMATMIAGVLNVPAYAQGNLIVKESFENVTGFDDLSEFWRAACYDKDGTGPHEYTPTINSEGWISKRKTLKLSIEKGQRDVRAYYTFPEKFNGMAKIRYSFKPGKDVKTVVWLSSTSGGESACLSNFEIEKSLSFLWNGEAKQPYTLATDLATDSWYDAEVNIDFVGKKINTKISNGRGKTWESVTASVNNDAFDKITFIIYNDDDVDSASSYFDDFEVEHFPLGFGVQSSKVGNIFDQNDKENFEVVVGNAADDITSGVVEWKIENEYTKEIKNGSADFAIHANGIKRFNIVADVKKFGTYVMTVGVKYYKNGVLTEDNEKRIIKFSKILASKNGEVNTNFGFATGHMPSGEDYAATPMDLMQKVGTSGIRAQISWQSIEGVDRNPNLLPSHQSIIDETAEGGRDLMITLAYGNKKIISQVDSDGNSVEPHEWRAPKTSDDIENFAKYCEYIVNQTKDTAKYYEVWNEWDGQFNVDGLGPKEYVNLLKVIYKRIKDIKPDAIVLSNSFGQYENFVEAIEAGMYEYCDGFVIHGYVTDSYFPSNDWVDRYNRRLRLLRNYEQEKNLTTKKYLYFNENGISSAYEYKAVDTNWLTITDIEQAKAVPKYFATVRGYDLSDLIHWFTLYDGGTDRSEIEDFWGALTYYNSIDYPHAAKPSYASIAAMNKLMNGGITNSLWKKIEVIEKKERRINNAYGTLGEINCVVSAAYPFVRGASSDGLGKNLAVLWSDDEKEFLLKLGCDSVDLYDLFGNKTTLSNPGGVYSIKLNNEVAYLAGDFTSFEEVSGNIDVVEYDAAKNIMNISGYIKGVENGATLTAEICNGEQVVKEIPLKITNGSFNKMFSFTEEGRYTIKIGNYAQREFETLPEPYNDNKIVSSIDSGVSVYIDDDMNICIEGKVLNRADDENVSVIIVPGECEDIENNILYINQISVADDGSFSDTLKVSGVGSNVDIYIGATNASSTKTDFVHSIYKVASLDLKELNGLTASALIYNSTDETEFVNMIIAQYTDDGQLLDVQIKEVEALRNVLNGQSFSYTVEKKKDAKICKAFLWKAGSDIVPLFDAVTVGGVNFDKDN